MNLIGLSLLLTVLGYTSGLPNLHSVYSRNSINEHPSVGIIDGDRAKINKYPYLASLTVDKNFFGSGIVVEKFWILTTAFTVAWIKPSQLFFRVGSNRYDKGGKVYRAEKVVVHENYSGSWDYDIALVKVSTEIKFNNKKGKAATLCNKDYAAATSAHVAGWGQKDKDSFTPSEFLRDGKVSIVDWKSCNESYSGTLTPRILCASDEKIRPCVYDYGDPLVVSSPDCCYGLFAGGYGCNSGAKPQLYTNIPEFIDWINNIISTNSTTNIDGEKLENVV